VNRSRVAHNTLLNFIGLAVPLALAFFVIPIVARSLGTSRFGLLAVAWAITEYLTLFDLGLGRALVKFVADALHIDSPQLSDIVSLSMATQLAAGLVGGAAFALAAPFFVDRVFHISPTLSGEALGVFRVVGLNVPAVLLMSGQRAVLEGAQRFDLSALLKMLASISALVIPAIGGVLGLSVSAILLWVFVARIVVCLLYAAAIRTALPRLRWTFSRDWPVLKRVVSFGGWVLVSNTISPLLVYFDRFALTSIAGLTAVGLYTAPYEGIVRLLIVPVSLFGSLLPALTSIEAGADSHRFTQVASSSERVLLPMMAMPLAAVFVFAPEILRVWLGPQYAMQSATAVRWLAAGVLANSLASPLLVTLYAKNRPDLPAKFHLIELAVHLPLTVFLIRTFGITGAAMAWTTRVVLDMVLLLWASARASDISVANAIGGRLAVSISLIALLLLGLSLAKILGAVSVLAGGVLALITVAAFVWGAWIWIVRDFERDALVRTINSYMNFLPNSAATGNHPS
jgi:O-antigen/teichoic acid export membrane protein